MKTASGSPKTPGCATCRSGLHAEPDLVRNRRLRLRPAGLDEDARPHRPWSPPPGTLVVPAAAICHPRSPGPTPRTTTRLMELAPAPATWDPWSSPSGETTPHAGAPTPKRRTRLLDERSKLRRICHILLHEHLWPRHGTHLSSLTRVDPVRKSLAVKTTPSINLAGTSCPHPRLLS